MKRKPKPTVSIARSATPQQGGLDLIDFDPQGRVRARKVTKPRTPWPRLPRFREGRDMISCDSKKLFGQPRLTAQQMAAWSKKNCSPRRTAREFHTGGPEAGTLVGARRAPGLFDDNWGNSFPLTRKEQQRVAAGELVEAPFFQPPTTPYEGNWIADKIELLRKKMAGSPYTTALNLNPLCGPQGSMTSCSTPTGTVSWVSETSVLTKADQERFAAAYCQPGCQTGGKATPPSGFTERVVIAVPRSPAVRLRFNCGPAPVEAPLIPGLPPIPAADFRPPNTAPPPPPGPGADMIECNGKKLFGAPLLTRAQMEAWVNANCGPHT